MDEEQILSRISVIERRHRRTIFLEALAFIVMAIVLFIQWDQIRDLRNPQKLRVRELAIVDEHGTERVVMAAPLPDPVIRGKRHKRDGAMSGIIICDSTGSERGGYATGDDYANAVLTLDSQGPQTVLLLAEPDGSTMFRLWNKNSSITMGAFDNPFLNMKQNGKLVGSTLPENPQSRDSRPLFR